METGRVSATPSGPIEQVLAWLRQYQVQLGLTLRMTIAATLSLAASQLLGLPLPLWVVLTSIVVTQMSVGRSLKAMMDYFAGTLGGAVFGTVVAVLVPHTTQLGLLAVLGLAVAPLAFAASLLPVFAIAPTTAVIVILLPGMTHSTSLVSAFDRVIEVALGGAVGLAVSFLIVPSNAHRLAIDTAAQTLDQMALAFRALFEGLETGLDTLDLHRLQDHIGQTLVQLGTMGSEAERERAARLAREPVMQPLLRSLLRLRHDLVMIGRVAVVKLPQSYGPRLRGPLVRVETAIVAYLQASGAAIRARQPPPAMREVDAALDAYGAEVRTLRSEHMTVSLSFDEAERFFALGFVLEQMHGNLAELQDRVKEWAAG